MKKRSVTSNYIFNLMYQLVVILVPLFTTPYLTRVLGSEKLGIYSYTLSIVTIFFLLAALGINTYGQREIAYVQDDKTKRSKIFWELFSIRIVSTLVSILFLLILSFISSYSLYYKLFIIYVLANMFDITWLYQGVEDFKAVSIRNLVIKFFYLIAIFLFVKNGNDLIKYIIIYSVSTLLTNLSFWINIKKYVEYISFAKLQIKKHIKIVFQLFIPQVAALIYTVLDKTMIGMIVPNISNVYYYEQASYIDKTILILITTIGTVMISRISNAFAKKEMNKVKKYLKETINFVWLLGSALAFGLCAVIKNFVPWFYGPDFQDIITLAYYMSPIIIIIGLNNIIGIQYLIPTKQQNKYIFAIVTGCIVNFIFNLILINLIGTKGAVISSVFAEFIILSIELYYVRDTISIKDVITPSYKYLLFGFIMFIITYLSGNILGSTILGTILQVVIGGSIYVALLLVSKDKFIKNYVFGYLKNFKRK